MPRIHLASQVISRKRVPEPGGLIREVVHLRLFTRVLPVGDNRSHEAIVDTGAPVSLFPVGSWKRLQGSDPTAGPLVIIPEHRTAELDSLPLYTILGCSYRARHAWIDLIPVDATDDHRRLAPTRVFAAVFVTRVEWKDGKWVPRDEDAKGLKSIVMGIGAGILDGRYLVLSPHSDPARRSAWLQDEPPPEPATGDTLCSSRIPPIP